MLWILLACSVGSTDPSNNESPHGLEAASLSQFSADAGRLANRSRDLERAAKEALDRINSGGNPQDEIHILEASLKDIEAINLSLHCGHIELQKRFLTEDQLNDVNLV